MKHVKYDTHEASEIVLQIRKSIKKATKKKHVDKGKKRVMGQIMLNLEAKGEVTEQEIQKNRCVDRKQPKIK